jgi:hypothetical protein
VARLRLRRGLTLHGQRRPDDRLRRHEEPGRAHPLLPGQRHR